MQGGGEIAALPVVGLEPGANVREAGDVVRHVTEEGVDLVRHEQKRGEQDDGGEHDEIGRQDALGAAHVELEHAVTIGAAQGHRHQKAADDEEDVDADEAAAKQRDIHMEQEDEGYSETAKDLDVGSLLHGPSSEAAIGPLSGRFGPGRCQADAGLGHGMRGQRGRGRSR